MNNALAIGIEKPKDKGGAPEGNQNAMKFKTPEERQALCDSYCKHKRQGYSDDSFKDCDMETFKHYRNTYPVDFASDKITEAMREYFLFWETIGINGTVGKPNYYQDKISGKMVATERFNSDSWKFNMSNRFKWRLNTDVTSQGEKLEVPHVIIDTKA